MRIPAFIAAFLAAVSLAVAVAFPVLASGAIGSAAIGPGAIGPAAISPGAIYEKSAPLAADAAYQRLYDGLEARGYFVIFEPNMGKSLAGMKDKFGADYNRNGLEVMRSLVFCNPTKTNRMSNLDPALLALCPLHITLTHKGGVSTAHFGRVSTLAAGSAGEADIKAIEAEIIAIVEDALHGE